MILNSLHVFALSEPKAVIWILIPNGFIGLFDQSTVSLYVI